MTDDDDLEQHLEDITDPLVHFRMADAILNNDDGEDDSHYIQMAVVHALLAIASEVRILRLELQEEVL